MSEKQEGTDTPPEDTEQTNNTEEEETKNEQNEEEQNQNENKEEEEQVNEAIPSKQNQPDQTAEQPPARRIVITQPEEVFSRVPHGRTKGHNKDSINFSKSQPLMLPKFTNHDNQDNTSENNNNNNQTNRPRTARNTNNRFSQTSKAPNQYQARNKRPNPNPYRPDDSSNRNRFSQTCPLNRPQSSRTSSTGNLLSQTQQRTYTMTPELENLKKQAIEQEPLEVDDNAILEDLLLLLSEERRQLAAQHDFKESQRRNEAIGYVMECQSWLQKIEAQKASMEDVQQRQEELEKQLEDFDIESREIRHKTKKKLRRKRNKLIKKHNVQIEELEEQWSSEEKTRLYNKSSNTLICLRRQLALLLQQCRFEDAADVQKQIDDRQRYEEDQNHNQMQQDFNEVYNKLKSRQADDLTYFDQNAEMELKKLYKRREKLRQALVNREKKIQDKSDTAQDADKLWNSMKTNRTRDIGNPDKFKSTQMMPTLKVSKNDLKDEKMVQSLSLPPLNMPKTDQQKKKTGNQQSNKKDDGMTKKKKANADKK